MADWVRRGEEACSGRGPELGGGRLCVCACRFAFSSVESSITCDGGGDGGGAQLFTGGSEGARPRPPPRTQRPSLPASVGSSAHGCPPTLAGRWTIAAFAANGPKSTARRPWGRYRWAAAASTTFPRDAGMLAVRRSIGSSCSVSAGKHYP